MQIPADMIFNSILLYRVVAKSLDKEEIGKLLEITKNEIISSDNYDINKDSLDVVISNIKRDIDKLTN